MSKLTRALPILMLLAAAAACVVLLALPWPPIERPSVARVPAQAERQAEDVRTSRGNPLSTVLNVAALFGYTEPKPAAPAPAASPPKVLEPVKPIPVPERALWLTPMGYVVDGDGYKKFLFKYKTETETILSLKAGESEKGVTLLQIDDDRFILERDGMPYYVERE